MTVADISELIEAASQARGNAYVPYSGYPVGAALEDETGRIHRGCNVENVSYPAGLCAERVAIGAMAAAGGRQIRQIAVVTQDGGTPCGICLQVLLEFGDPDQTIILVVDESGETTRYRLRDLIPHGFLSKLPMRANESNR